MPGKNVIYNAEVQVSVNEKGILSAAKRVKQASQKMKRDLQLEAGTIKPTKEFRQLGTDIKAAEKELQRLNRERDRLAKQHKQSDDYKRLSKDIDIAEKSLEKLRAKRDSFLDLGVGHGDSKITAFNNQIKEAITEIARLKQAQKGIAESGATENEKAEWQAVGDAIDKAEKELDQYKAKRDKMEADGSAYANQKPPSAARMIRDSLASKAGALGGMLGSTKAGSAISGMFGQMRAKLAGIGAAGRGAFTFMKGVANDSSRVRTGIAGIAKRIRELRAGGKIFPKLSGRIRGVGRSANFATKHLKKMKRGLAMGTGIKGLARLGLAGAGVYAMLRGLRQGFENLQGYSGQTANDINTLRGSLETCKNAMATAFAPILSAITPALQTLIGWLTAASTAIAHFMAALTGKSSVVVAKPMGAVASGAQSAAGATGDANKAAKEYQKTLMGFDQINKLDDPTKDTSGGGGGGGGGGAGGGAFETVDVNAGAKDLAAKIKEAWRKADFTEVGKIVGEKLNKALEKIPWGKIQNTAKKLGKSIATFLNGFLEGTNWTLVGNTIAQGINTAILFAYNFVANFKWYKFGNKMAEGFNGLFKNLRWKTAAKTLSKGLAGIFKVIAGWAENVDWGALVDKIWSFLANIDYGEILKWLARALGAVVGALARVAIRLFQHIGKAIVSGIKKGSKAGWKGIGSWIKKTIFDPFIKGFKKAFGIASPSKEMKKQGGYIIDGLLEGLKDKIKDVFEWFTELPEKLLEALGDLGETIKDGVSGAISFAGNVVEVGIGLVQKGWTTVKSWIESSYLGEAVLKGIGVVRNGWTKISDWIKNTHFGGAVNKAIGVVRNGWTKISTWIKDSYFGGAVRKAIGIIRDGWTRVSTWIKNNYMGNIVTKGISLIRDGWTTVKKWITDKWLGGSVKVPVKLGGGGGGGWASGAMYSSGRWKPITAAASGGAFNQGQMFVAREAGPELVGTIGGNTSVMNNDQIVASVSAGVARAVASVMRNNESTVNVYLQGDAGQIFKVVQNQATQYTNTTGQSPFPA